VKIDGKNICEVCAMTVEQGAEFFKNVQLRPQEAGIAEKLLEEIRSRLGFLNDVGLEYLMLDRLTSTLSGGEAQRIQLATSLGSRLVGTLYVLDEPSIGLHSRDTHRLIGILHGLRDLGNTVLVVEHDPDVMKASDHILDLGPGAGEQGGKVIAQGTYKEVSFARAADSHSAEPSESGPTAACGARRTRAQSEEYRRHDPAGFVGSHHGSLGVWKVEPAARCPVQGAEHHQGEGK
jgi:excinuclease UvrABC ATPase subunit